ncbi:MULTISPECIES: hypothetical protein [Rhizobium/Agrobacterium group]|uniref:hypothetical protein n=1 Tax=Rhizobium/Agrobacterium group TaxID=227290 RepID=UPI000B401DBF|nr:MULTISPECIES: hypothetical protein [Rhizobium/Agrobacterium group]NSZ15579.1 hypothetical protein [Agrobacterium vitis]NSZ41576.1 hypothetical protein [Agrobacterium vitis]NTA25259.1 hypothetical protein [Allorhizobium ampelinum]OVE98095.1 hypothetical protein B7W85_01930 [Allorhizobium ampelinum]QZO04420.1 hypothetical protein K4831_02300 [Agrobacterium vitis]
MCETKIIRGALLRREDVIQAAQTTTSFLRQKILPTWQSLPIAEKILSSHTDIPLLTLITGYRREHTQPAVMRVEFQT